MFDLISQSGLWVPGLVGFILGAGIAAFLSVE